MKYDRKTFESLDFSKEMRNTPKPNPCVIPCLPGLHFWLEQSEVDSSVPKTISYKGMSIDDPAKFLYLEYKRSKIKSYAK